jgi:hypothetical protein
LKDDEAGAKYAVVAVCNNNEVPNSDSNREPDEMMMLIDNTKTYRPYITKSVRILIRGGW